MGVAERNSKNLVTDFGKDFSYATGDLSPTLGESTGLQLVAEALYRRFMVEHGSWSADPDYGYSLTQFINEGIPDVNAIKQRAEAECMKDERVRTADATVTFNTDTEELKLDLVIGTSQGPFELVVGVNGLTAELLNFKHLP